MKESKLNTALKEELFLINKKMTPRERLNAFVEHSRLLALLFKAGEDYRKRNTSRKILLTVAKKKK